jgi:hypothetical protein
MIVTTLNITPVSKFQRFMPVCIDGLTFCEGFVVGVVHDTLCEALTCVSIL